MPIGGTAVLVIDEAQHLLPPCSNTSAWCRTSRRNKARLLQIVLIGQTVAARDAGTRGLCGSSRRACPCGPPLRPLTRDEIEAYVAHRLRVAHGMQPPRFDASAHDAVAALTGGVPALPSTSLCDRALMLGAQLGALDITVTWCSPPGVRSA